MRLHPARGWLPSGGFRGRSLLRLAGFGSCGPPGLTAMSLQLPPARGLRLSLSLLSLSCFVRTLVVGFGAHLDDLELLIS